MKKEEGVRTSLPWAKQASKKIAWRACGAIVDGAQRRTGPNLGGKAALARKGICKICFKWRTTLLRSLHSDRNNGSTPPTHKKKKSWTCARRHISTVSRHGVGSRRKYRPVYMCAYVCVVRSARPHGVIWGKCGAPLDLHGRERQISADSALADKKTRRA